MDENLCNTHVCTCVCDRERVEVTAIGPAECVLVAADAGKCEEQFQVVTIPVRETETDRERGKTSQRGSQAARMDLEEWHAGNAKTRMGSHTYL